MTLPDMEVLHLLAANALLHYKITGKLRIKYFFLANFCCLYEAAKFCPLPQVFKLILWCFTPCLMSSITTVYPHIFDAQISALVKFYSSRKSYLFNIGTIALFLNRTLYSNI